MSNRSNRKGGSAKRYRHTTICLSALLLVGISKLSYAQSAANAVRDLPFSANEWVTKTSTTADGTVSATTQQIAIARASDGTVRREVHEPSAGPDRVVGKPIVVVAILNQDTKSNSATFRGKAAATAMDLSKLQNVSKAPVANNAKVKPSSSSAKPETTTLNGLQAVVHRSQYTVPASAPSGKTVTVTTALWYSPDLRVTLKSSISDSDGTTVDTILDDIHRQEPDSSLFHISTEAKAAQK